MVVYKNAAQVERLLRAIYQPQNVYCIHVDKTSPPQFQKAIRTLSQCFDNVFIASKLEDVKWGSYSAVLADLHCVEDLLNHPVQWRYLLNVCGMDFPLKTNFEMVQQLKAYNNHNCIEGYKRKDTEGERARFKKTKAKAPHNIKIYGGDTYIAATREFANFTIYDRVAQDYLKWLKNVHVPDEYYTASLNRLPYAPGGHVKPSMDCNVRFRKWTHNKKFGDRPQCIGKKVRLLCIFSAGYLKYWYRTPQLFVNKLDYEFDPIAIQCMEELLDYRTYHSEDFNNWQNFPVTDYYWQQDSKPTKTIDMEKPR
ncbi:beta-1,3-galactosyl-O-glycosyl-glycoprotein beta-1,6-N-acetylglucosaminyltransferase 3-like [Amphiura filiformis]|uniref:beta-1,3-galactosyl-O-glycosyl-glycoprotein beta-1,6-N-acetylglucosaminyltransferase 3-like n=1 Tax=Amphiura filiformis TaxID=82378 RepID=UPI003B219C08